MCVCASDNTIRSQLVGLCQNKSESDGGHMKFNFNTSREGVAKVMSFPVADRDRANQDCVYG